MGKIVLDPQKSQEKPAPRPQNWYDDEAALKRVYPESVLPGVRVPNYNPTETAQLIAEFDALTKGLKNLGAIHQVPRSNGIIQGFYRNILKRLSPQDDDVKEMADSKFKDLEDKDLIWVKKFLESIIDHIAKNNDLVMITSVVDALEHCGGGVVDELRSQHAKCMEPEGLLEVLAESRQKTLSVITVRHIKDRNEKAKQANRKIEKDEEGYERHIPIVFRTLCMLNRIDIPASIIAGETTEEGLGSFDTHRLELVYDDNDKLIFYQSDEQRRRARIMNFENYDFNNFGMVFFDTYGEVVLETFANHLETVIKGIFEEGFKNKEIDNSAEDPFKAITDILRSKYKADLADLKEFNTLLFRENSDTEEYKAIPQKEFYYWCQVLVAQILVKNGIAQAYEKIDLGSDLSMVKAGDLTYFTHRNDLVTPGRVVELATKNGALEQLLLSLQKDAPQKPEYIYLELLIAVQVLKNDESDREELHERSLEKREKDITENKAGIIKFQGLIDEEMKKDTQDADDIEYWEQKIADLKKPLPALPEYSPLQIPYDPVPELNKYFLDATYDQQVRMIESGAIDILKAINNQYPNHLHYAIKNNLPEIFHACLKRLTTVDQIKQAFEAQDNAGQRLILHLVIHAFNSSNPSNLQMLKALFETGAFLDIQTHEDHLNYIVEKDPKLLLLIINHTPTDKITFKYIEILMRMDPESRQGIPTEIQQWIELCQAVQKNDENALIALVQAGVDFLRPINLQNQNIIHLAIEKGWNSLFSLCYDKNPDILRLESNSKWQPIHYAVKYANLPVLNFLIAKGADLNAQTSEQSNVLYLALQADNLQARRSMVELLLQSGELPETINKKNSRGITPLMAALNENEPEIALLLLEKGAAFEKEAMNWAIKKGSKELIEALFPLKPKNYNTLLYAYNINVYYTNRELLFTFIELGEDPLVVFPDQYSFFDRMIIENKKNIIDLCIDKYPNIVNNTNVRGMQAIHLAASNGNFEVFKLILTNTENINMKTTTGETALSLAFSSSIDRYKKLELLLNHSEIHESVIAGETQSYTPTLLLKALEMDNENEKRSVLRLLLSHGVPLTHVLKQLIKPNDNYIEKLIVLLNSLIHTPDNPHYQKLLEDPHLELIYQLFESKFPTLCEHIGIFDDGIDALKIYAQAQVYRFKNKPQEDTKTYQAKIKALETAISKNDGQAIIDALKLHNTSSWRGFWGRDSQTYVHLPATLKAVYENNQNRWPDEAMIARQRKRLDK